MYRITTIATQRKMVLKVGLSIEVAIAKKTIPQAEALVAACSLDNVSGILKSPTEDINILNAPSSNKRSVMGANKVRYNNCGNEA